MIVLLAGAVVSIVTAEPFPAAEYTIAVPSVKASNVVFVKVLLVVFTLDPLASSVTAEPDAPDLYTSVSPVT